MDKDEENNQLDCGIDYARLRAWLDGSLALKRGEDGLWRFEYESSVCEIGLEKLDDRPLGTISLPRTQLSIAGDNRSVAQFIKLFTLQFLSSGG